MEHGNRGDAEAIGAIFHAAAVAPTADGQLSRAYFYAITGQLDRHEAFDPDSSLLATGYRLLSTESQAALRAKLVDAGSLAVVRTLTRDRSPRELASGEIDDLARALADKREWAQLWDLVLDAPLDRALSAMRLFDAWRPREPAAATLFDRLTTADPRAITSLLEAMARTIRGSWSNQCAFAPDASEIAIRYGKSVAVFAVADGRELHRYPSRWGKTLVHLGNGAVVYLSGTAAVRSLPGGAPDVLARDGWGLSVARTADGFVISHRDELRFGTASSSTLRKVRLAALGVAEPIWELSSHPASGRLAILSRPGELVLLDADLTVVARGSSESATDLVLHEPDRLLTWSGAPMRVQSWRRDGDTLIKQAEVTLPSYPKVACWPNAGTVALRVWKDLIWLNANTLAKAAPPPGFRWSADESPYFSPDGDYAAVPVIGGVVVRHLLSARIAEFVAMPMASMQPETLRAIADIQRKHGGQVVALLRERLEHRYGTEIALSAGQSAPPDDIALGGG